MQSLILNVFPAQLKISENAKTQVVISLGFVTLQRLIALGIVANVLFWGGLLVPYHGSASSEIAFLHAFVAMLGGALALGGATAVMLRVARQATVRLRSMELVAAVFHFSVIIAFAALSFSAFLRG
jgi:hypothetical protein